MDKIEKICQELERLKGICMAQIKTNPGHAFPFVMEMTGYDKLLSFLKTLSEEPDRSLEEAAEEFAEGEWDGVAVDTDGNPLYAQDEIEYAFKAGAEWQASQMPMPEDTALFNKGVAEGRRLMMEEAVEGEVVVPIYEGNDVWSTEIKITGRYELGDKVRIIVLKAEED